jgi:hypothetical protein
MRPAPLTIWSSRNSQPVPSSIGKLVMTRAMRRLEKTPSPSRSTGAAFGDASSQRQTWPHAPADCSASGSSQ